MYYAIKAFPRDDELIQLETVELGKRITYDSIERALGANSQPIRAAEHGGWLFFGLATGAQPLHIDCGCSRLLTLRGPTVWFPYEGTACLDNVLIPPGPPDQNNLQLWESMIFDGEGNEELRPWLDYSTSALIPTIHPHKTSSGASGVKAALEKLLGGGVKISEIQTGTMDKHGNLFVGRRAVDVWPIEKCDVNQIPVGFDQMLDVVAYVASRPGHFPTPAATLMSCASFYLETLEKCFKMNMLDEHALSRLESLSRITDFLRQEKARVGLSKNEFHIDAGMWSGDKA